MKSVKRMLVAMSLLLVLGINTMNAEEAEDKVEFGITADYYGKYIWRGQNLNDDPAFQPGFSAAYKGFTAGIWGSLETTDIFDNKGEFTEVDYYADYSADVPGVEGLGFSIGFIYYDFPNTDLLATTELYWGFSYDTFLSPSIKFYHDIDEAEGLYVSAGIGHSIDLGEDAPIGIDLGASIGWGDTNYNEYYWGTDSSGFNDLLLSAAFPFEIGGLSITPSVKYSILIDSDIKDADTYSSDDSEFFVGIGLSMAF